MTFVTQHDSDCAQHNEPAYPNGPCNCSASLTMTDTTAGEGVYRKTATIRATQWFKMGDHHAVKPYYKDGHTNDLMGDHGWIDTLEGGHVVSPGDWIATGMQGEHWPVKPDVFAATYTLAAQPSAGAQGEAWKPTTDELANCREGIAEAREGMKRMMGDNVPPSMTEVMIEADWLEKVCDHFATPAQPDTGEVAALRDFAEYVSGQMHNLPRSATADAVNERAESILAALSKPNAPGREG